MLKYIFILCSTLFLWSCILMPNSQVTNVKTENNLEKITKSEKEWSLILTKEEFHIIRKKGTERAYSGDYWNNEESGIYNCKACKLPLFDSRTKFKSGTGWPSFYDIIDTKNIHKETDHLLGYPRTELTCMRCDGHLGHVFEDGPKPTGLRYCINSASLVFEKN